MDSIRLKSIIGPKSILFFWLDLLLATIQRLSIKWGCGLLFLIITATSFAEDEKDQERRYAQGLLKNSEFSILAKDDPANESTYLAYTFTQLRYNYRYQSQSSKKSYSAKISEVEIYSIFLPEKSWRKQDLSPAILAHEQGHFDLTYILSLEAQIHFIQETNAGNAIEVKGRLKKKVIEELVHALDRKMNRYYDQAALGHRQYDEITKHGRRKSAQHAIQIEHRKRIASLEKELAELQPDAQ